jgi:hypothetical protein
LAYHEFCLFEAVLIGLSVTTGLIGLVGGVLLVLVVFPKYKK